MPGVSFQEHRQGGQDLPGARWAHTITPLGQREGALLFGGFASKVYRNDAWLLTAGVGSGAGAIQLRPSDVLINPSDAAAGYKGADAAHVAARGGGFARDFSSQFWYPSVRSNHTAFAMEGCVIIYGGAEGKKKLEDAFVIMGTRGDTQIASGSLCLASPPTSSPSNPDAAYNLPPLAFAAGAQLSKASFIIFSGVGKSAAGEFPGALVATLLESLSSATTPVALPPGFKASVQKLPDIRMVFESVPLTGSNMPSARKCHVMCAAPAPYASPSSLNAAAEPANLVLLHGGCVGDTYEPLGDTWALVPLSSDVSEQLAKERPSPASAHLITVPVLAGDGSGSRARLSFAWTQPAQAGTRPTPRWGHTLTSVPGRPTSEPAFILIGGFGVQQGGARDTQEWVDLNDVFVLTALFGSPVSPTSATRSCEAALLVPSIKLTWSSVTVETPFPSRRRLASAALSTDCLIIFGGFDTKQKYYSDIWSVNTDDILRDAGVPRLRVTPAPMAAAAASAELPATLELFKFPSTPTSTVSLSNAPSPLGPMSPAMTTPPFVRAEWVSRLGMAHAFDANTALRAAWCMLEESRKHVDEVVASSAAAAQFRGGGKSQNEVNEMTHALNRQQQELAQLSHSMAELKLVAELARREAAAGADALSRHGRITSDLLRAQADVKSFERKFLEADRRGRCIACEDTSKSVVYLPCKHLAYCAKCRDDVAARAKEKNEQPICPICRSPVKSSIEVIGVE